MFLSLQGYGVKGMSDHANLSFPLGSLLGSFTPLVRCRLQELIHHFNLIETSCHRNVAFQPFQTLSQTIRETAYPTPFQYRHPRAIVTFINHFELSTVI